MGTRWIAALLSAAVMVGCGGGVESAADEEGAEDFDLSFNCNESRGALLQYQMMVDGQSRIDEGSLDTWPLARLAEERKAPAEVTQHIEGWNQVRRAWRDALRAMPPVFADGRVVEPDTTGIDRQMMVSIGPHHRALKQWVKLQCGEP
jgi:hypothetical protein